MYGQTLLKYKLHKEEELFNRAYDLSQQKLTYNNICLDYNVLQRKRREKQQEEKQAGNLTHFAASSVDILLYTQDATKLHR